MIQNRVIVEKKAIEEEQAQIYTQIPFVQVVFVLPFLLFLRIGYHVINCFGHILSSSAFLWT